MTEKLKVGVLLDSKKIPAWSAHMLGEIRASEYAEICCVIINSALQGQSVGSENGKLDKLFYRLYRDYEDKKFRLKPDALKLTEAESFFAECPEITGSFILKDSGCELDESAVVNLRKYQLDVIIYLGFENLTGEILQVAKYGIWRINIGKFKTTPGAEGFWEVIRKQPTTESSLEIVNRKTNKVIIARSHSSTNEFSVKKNINKVYWRSALFIPRKLRELHKSGERTLLATNHDDDPTEYKRNELNNLRTLFPIVRHFIKYFNKKIMEHFFVDKWILLYKYSEEPSTSFQDYKKIIAPKDKLWADPYVIYRNRKYYIFFEEAYLKNKKGFISLLVMDEDGNFEKPVKILEKPYHLSYPFLLEWQDKLYMIPESSANRTIEVYECKEFPDKWRFCKNLMEDIVAADATLFYHDKTWWLFANVREIEGTSNWEELFLFYADSPLSENWTPHPQNPVVSDVRSARPAGKLYRHDGKICRVAQNSSIRYGYGLKFMQIVKLSRDEYIEEEVHSVEPNWNFRIRGVHTFNFEGNLAVSDAIYRTRKF